MALGDWCAERGAGGAGGAVYIDGAICVCVCAQWRMCGGVCNCTNFEKDTDITGHFCESGNCHKA